MFQRSILRQQNLLRSVCIPCRRNLLLRHQQQRRCYSVPPLGHQELLEKYGIPDFLTPGIFKLAWTKYQAYLVDKMNSATHGTPLANMETKDLAVKTARNSQHATLFNYASMAHNNHFFFRTLRTPNPSNPSAPLEPMSIPSPIAREIQESFGSVETFRDSFLLTASSMFGPGFVWLMQQAGTGSLSILTTYNAGSPYPEAHFRKQNTDMNTIDGVPAGTNPQEYQSQFWRQHNEPQNSVGRMGRYAGNTKVLAPGGIDMSPILCVNTWEHVWVPDWDITGKDGYLAAWWKHIDWNEVGRFGQFRQQSRTADSMGYRQIMEGRPVDVSGEMGISGLARGY